MNFCCRPRGIFALLPRLLVLAAVIFWSQAPASALVEIDITRGNVEPLPIALVNFGGELELGAQIIQVVTSDLKRSGLFRPIDQASFLQKDLVEKQSPKFGDWRVINAQALVNGSVTEKGGKITAQFHLWDVFAAEHMMGQEYTANSQNWRRIAHIIADAIYKRLTGEKGYFDSRIVFVDETGTKQNRTKRLAIMDQDGANVRYLTQGDDLVITPRFSPSRQEITYMSFAEGRPRVYLLNIETGQREIVGNFPGMTFSPRFSPDGQKVIMSLQQDGNSNLFEMDLRSRSTFRLTNTAAIDTSPSYSPDGKTIVFESDRGGSQQIYMIEAGGTNPRRISFGSGSYSTPVWSPRGDLIAFTKRTGGKFMIGVMRPDGSRERVLTEGFHNEGPTWAPNGRVLMFFRDVPGVDGGPQLWSIDLSGHHETRISTPSFASDPAWSPLLN